MDTSHLSEQQLDLISQINAKTATKRKRTREEELDILGLVQALVRASQPPLNFEKAWLDGFGKGTLNLSYRTYINMKTRCGLTKVRTEEKGIVISADLMCHSFNVL